MWLWAVCLFIRWCKHSEQTLENIVEKNQTNATSVTLHRLRQTIWGFMLSWILRLPAWVRFIAFFLLFSQQKRKVKQIWLNIWKCNILKEHPSIHPDHLPREENKKVSLIKRRQTPSTMDSTVEKTASSSFSCDQCDYTYASEKGLRQHKRMKQGKSQPEHQLQSSSPSSPENLREPTSYSTTVSSALAPFSSFALYCSTFNESSGSENQNLLCCILNAVFCI